MTALTRGYALVGRAFEETSRFAQGGAARAVHVLGEVSAQRLSAGIFWEVQVIIGVIYMVTGILLSTLWGIMPGADNEYVTFIFEAGSETRVTVWNNTLVLYTIPIALGFLTAMYIAWNLRKLVHLSLSDTSGTITVIRLTHVICDVLLTACTCLITGMDNAIEIASVLLVSVCVALVSRSEYFIGVTQIVTASLARIMTYIVLGISIPHARNDSIARAAFAMWLIGTAFTDFVCAFPHARFVWNFCSWDQQPGVGNNNLSVEDKKIATKGYIINVVVYSIGALVTLLISLFGYSTIDGSSNVLYGTNGNVITSQARLLRYCVPILWISSGVCVALSQYALQLFLQDLLFSLILTPITGCDRWNELLVTSVAVGCASAACILLESDKESATEKITAWQKVVFYRDLLILATLPFMPIIFVFVRMGNLSRDVLQTGVAFTFLTALLARTFVQFKNSNENAGRGGQYSVFIQVIQMVFTGLVTVCAYVASV